MKTRSGGPALLLLVPVLLVGCGREQEKERGRVAEAPSETTPAPATPAPAEPTMEMREDAAMNRARSELTSRSVRAASLPSNSDTSSGAETP